MTSRLASALKITGISLLVCFGLFVLAERLNAAWRSSPEASDFAQDYLLAKAIVSGMDPYLPLNVLGERFGITTQFTHPSPQPPSFAILCIPLVLVSYKHGALIWLVLSLVSLLISLRILFKVRNWVLLVIFLVSIAWPPVWSNLYLGQSLLFQLLILTLTWLWLRSRRDPIGGLLLGFLISIKIIMWPLLLFLIIKKRFGAVLPALGVIVFTHLVALLLIGPKSVFTYYLFTGREVASIYNDNLFSFSAWSLGARFFVGAKTLGTVPMVSEPLINAPALSSIMSIVCVLAIFGYALFVALKSKAFNLSFAALVGASIILSPVAWVFYLPLLMPSIAIMRGLATWRSRAAIIVCLIAPIISQVVFRLFNSPSSFFVGMLTMFPLGAVLLMIAVLHQEAQLIDAEEVTG